MITYTVSPTIYNICTWPLVCVYCGHDKLVHSKYKDDVRCQCCGKWQMKEEE